MEQHRLQTAVEGMLPLAAEGMAPLAVEGMPPLAVEDMPPLAVEDMPPLAVEGMPPLAVEGMGQLLRQVRVHFEGRESMAVGVLHQTLEVVSLVDRDRQEALVHMQVDA